MLVTRLNAKKKKISIQHVKPRRKLMDRFKVSMEDTGFPLNRYEFLVTDIEGAVVEAFYVTYEMTQDVSALMRLFSGRIECLMNNTQERDNG
jgi:hypothetical protein